MEICKENDLQNIFGHKQLFVYKYDLVEVMKYVHDFSSNIEMVIGW